MSVASQITTLSFFRFPRLGTKFWAFGMMQFAHAPLKKVEGLRFYRLLGTGKQRFNPLPDWSTYAILQVWDSEEHALNFINSSSLYAGYVQKSEEHWTLFLKNTIARGQWGGSNPFQRTDLDAGIPYVVAITRATIKTRLLLKFWRYVPKSQDNLWDNDGLLYTKGVGEFPIRQMATFSLWRDKKSLDSFAYQSKAHVGAIAKTRQLDWYKEELFARFQPYCSVGSWNGSNPLPDLARPEKT